MKGLLRHTFLTKLLHWEFWPSGLVYSALYPYWAWLSLKARSFYFLTAANPGIKNGGYIMESKRAVYDLLEEGTYPTTLYFEPGTALHTITDAMINTHITYPLVLKPDIGERGLGVKKIMDEAALSAYIAKMPINYLVQAYVPYEQEVGIFYWRMPDQEAGTISGIVSKHPVVVAGDGKRTVAQLVRANSRYALYFNQLKQQNESLWASVPPKGQKLNLMPYGNHCRGSLFLNEKDMISPNLTATIDRICKRIPGFYYGRLDIKFDNWTDLAAGKNLSIIEVNGSGSEPTHIYSPGTSLLQAWGEITKHWDILYAISSYNKNTGMPCLSLQEGWAEEDSFKKIEMQLRKQVW
jgi:hypothetical protein